jgi:UPF0755 protein
LVRILSSLLKVFSIVVLAIVVAGGSVWFFNYWQDQQRSSEIGRPVTVEITDEDDTTTVAEKLTKSDLVRYGFYFETRMRFSGVELRPGVYTLRVGMSVPEIINVITIEDTGSASADAETEGTTAPKSFEVTFIEGQRIEQNAAVLEQAGMPNGSADYIAAANDTDSYRSSYPFLDSVPQGASLEGFLFPDTYTVGENATAGDVIGLQLSNFEAKFTPEMMAQAESRGMSIYEAVTLASIVEREAAIPEERPQIAAVYLNRIAEGMPLQADPIQQYGVGTAEEWWPTLNTELLEQSKATEYDSYDNVGLPPGPIANPGFASLQAVLQPADVEYLYFVTTGDESGAHIFSTTYEEHLVNMCREHPEFEDCGGSGTLPLHSPLADRARWTREFAA